MAQLQMFEDPTGQMSSEETNAQNIQQIMEELNRQDATIQNLNKTQIIADNTGVNRILIGVAPNGTSIGIYVSKTGYDITQQF